MTKVPIVQLFDTRQQKGECKTQKLGKTEPIDVIESHFVGFFRVRSFYTGIYYVKV
jgi:hypothetical protein